MRDRDARAVAVRPGVDEREAGVTGPHLGRAGEVGARLREGDGDLVGAGTQRHGGEAAVRLAWPGAARDHPGPRAALQRDVPGGADSASKSGVSRSSSSSSRWRGAPDQNS